MPVDIRSIKFWMNAFIPRDVPKYSKPVPGHPGLTMIPGPMPWSDCFHTDQRGFSSNIHAKSRMHAEFRLEFGRLPPTLTQWHNCDYTTECDCDDGDVECHEKGTISRMSFSLLPSRVCSPTGPFEVWMQCCANNPCSPSSRAFGDIDFEGRITVNLFRRSIEIDGVIDQFPAFEAYATINDGAGVTLFQIPPPPGNTVMNLPGKANRRIRFRLEDRNGDGVFDALTRLG
jgi:hypothetical protein